MFSQLAFPACGDVPVRAGLLLADWADFQMDNQFIGFPGLGGR
jgi:hypothetical protein